MEYVTVIGTDPGQERTSHIYNYFDKYLISMGDPTTTKGWTLSSVNKHFKHIIKQSKKFKQKLYIDSGGFQIIMGYITFDPTGREDRIREFVDTYHFLLGEYSEYIHRIFSLDVNNFDMTTKQIYDSNVYSMQSSINLIKKNPEIKNKQLFVLQNRNHRIFEIWRQLIINLEVYKYYKLWSFGGLVGLKKDTNAKFSHVVPSTMWLLTYQKHFNFEIEQIHFLGQGSRLNFLVVAVLEELFDLDITCDSSQLVRFAPPIQKLPIIHIKKEAVDLMEAGDYSSITDDDFLLITQDNLEDLEKLFKYNSLKTMNMTVDNKPVHSCEISITEEMIKNNRMTSTHMLEMMSIATRNDMLFAVYIKNKIMAAGWETVTVDQMKKMHPITGRGHISRDMTNNLNFIKAFMDIKERGDIKSADGLMYSILDSYQARSEEQELKKSKEG